MQTGSPDGRTTDWEALEHSSEFQELVRQKRRYVTPRVVFFLVWYLGFVLLAGYAPDFMGESVYEGLTVGYVLALTQFIMVWFLAWSYVRKADRDFDPLEQAVIDKAEAGQFDASSESAQDGRVERSGTTATVRS